MGGSSKVDAISSNGCSRMFNGSLSFKGLNQMNLKPVEPDSPAALSSSSSVVSRNVVVRSMNGPFSGLVICVTGLSKEARKQVMDAAERLGGQYSPHLHHQCTHLVVQSFGGLKLKHALKHGAKNGLFVVTLGWFVDSVRKNARLNESFYTVKKVGENDMFLNDSNRFVGFSGAENSCLPTGLRESPNQLGIIEEQYKRNSGGEPKLSVGPVLSNHLIFVDLDVSSELRSKVIEAALKEGAKFLDQWFVGCHASHVVCEAPSVRGYLGHSNNIVTPLWILKTVKERKVQRLVHMSADLARQVGLMLENHQNGIAIEEVNKEVVSPDALKPRKKASHKERQQITDLAKAGVRHRRGRRMQTCHTPIRPITPSSLLDSICWSISEPTYTASIYTDSFSAEDSGERHKSVFYNANLDVKESEASFANFSRPLKEIEKAEFISKNHFLTILFPIDRFSEMGPSSRTFYSDKGFTCLKVLDLIYAFYQENMSSEELEAAIHTDSRHADRLRSVYASEETAKSGYVTFRRIDFLGSRKSFEMLKRVNGDNNSSIYELLIRA